MFCAEQTIAVASIQPDSTAMRLRGAKQSRDRRDRWKVMSITQAIRNRRAKQETMDRSLVRYSRAAHVLIQSELYARAAARSVFQAGMSEEDRFRRFVAGDHVQR